MGLQFTTTVTIIGEPTIVGYDKGNRPIYGDSETPSPGWIIWPGGLTESTESEEIDTDNLEGFAPPGTVLSSVQKVRVPMYPDKVFDVVGTSWPWRSPFTNVTPGVSVKLKAAT